MKICFVCNEYPPTKHGGIGTFVQSLGRALVASGHKVRAIGFESGLLEARLHVDEGVTVYRFPVPRVSFGWLFARAQVYRKISKWARDREIDIVEAPDYLGLAAYWPRLNVPVVTRLHGSLAYYANELSTKRSRLGEGLENASLRRSDFVCSVSHYAAGRSREIFDLGQRDITVIHNSVRIFDSELPCRSENKVVFGGTITRKKGIISLVQSWPAVLRDHPMAELHIYGKDGVTENGQSLTETLRAGICGPVSNSVHFHGHVDSNTLRNALRTARVCVFPSYSEAFSLAPMEAMAEGCPTIFTKHATGRELIEDGKHGLLVDPDHPEEISRAISQVLDNDDIAARLGAAGKSRIVNDFSPSQWLRKNEDFYAACMKAFRSNFGGGV